MPFCTNCGKEVGENEKFCSNCGNPLQEDEKAAKKSSVQANSPKTSSKKTNKLIWIIVPLILVAVAAAYYFWSGNTESVINNFETIYSEEILNEVGKIEPIDPEKIVEDPETGIDVVKDQILIVFKEGVSQETVDKKIASLNGEIIGYIAGMHDYQVRINGISSIEQLKEIEEKLNNDSDVESVILNYMMYGVSRTPNDKWFVDKHSGDIWDEDNPYGYNWGVEAIKVPSAWEYNDEMGSIRIGVVDVGFDINHEDLQIPKDYLMSARCELTKTKKSYQDHGTHVTGTIGAISNNNAGITGIVWNRELYLWQLGTIQDLNYTQIFDIKMGIEWLLKNDVKVINLSLGANWKANYGRVPVDGGAFENTFIIKASNYWTPFINKMVNKYGDFILVQAAGNDNIDTKWNGILTSVNDNELRKRIIIVGALENVEKKYLFFIKAKKHLKYKYADFSNYGELIDVAAPGVEIYSTVSNNGYDSKDWSGTSMAAPHVTGVAAMVWAINPDLTPEQVKEIVVSTADRPVKGPYGRYYNIVNAEKAVEKVLNSLEVNYLEYINKGIIPEEKYALGTPIEQVIKELGNPYDKDVFEGADYYSYNGIIYWSRDQKTVTSITKFKGKAYGLEIGKSKLDDVVRQFGQGEITYDEYEDAWLVYIEGEFNNRVFFYSSKKDEPISVCNLIGGDN